jgi:hypothetical protein
MAGLRQRAAGAAVALLDVEGLLLRAALLTGYGRGAPPLARRLAAATRAGSERSCLEAGTPIQLTVDAPGPPGLRVGLRIGDRFTARSIEDLVPPRTLEQLTRLLSPLPAAEQPGLGTWLFWTEARQSIFADLRDADPAAALARLRCVLSPAHLRRLEAWPLSAHVARPWSLRVEADDAGVRRLDVHWLLSRHASPQSLADTLAPGCWAPAMQALAHLLRWPGKSGRWVVATPLHGEPRHALRVGNTGWTLVPEDENKHRAVGEIMSALGGPRDHAQALWSLCRGAAAAGWRVGRACELVVGADAARSVRVRLFFSPQVQGVTTAGTSSSAAVAGTSAVALSDGDPFRA